MQGAAAPQVFKLELLVSWGMEMVDRHVVNFIRFSFMLAGHTKFAPDRLFSQIATSYNHSDIFTIEELQMLCQMYAECYIEDGTNVGAWRDILGHKYSNLPGVRSFHDFLILRPCADEDVIMKVRERCFDPRELPKVSPLRVITADHLPPLTYYNPGRVQPITGDKMMHMVQMYDTFIPLDRRPAFLPSFNSHPQSTIGTPLTCTSQTLTQSAADTANLTSAAPIGTAQVPGSPFPTLATHSPKSRKKSKCCCGL